MADSKKLSFFESAIQRFLDIKNGSKFWWLPWFPAKNHSPQTVQLAVYIRDSQELTVLIYCDLKQDLTCTIFLVGLLHSDLICTTLSCCQFTVNQKILQRVWKILFLYFAPFNTECSNSFEMIFERKLIFLCA